VGHEEQEEEAVMRAFWVEFEKHHAVCIEAATAEDASRLALAATGEAATKVRDLPYPAIPRVGEQSECPAFCYSPQECAGRTSCPKSYACSE
jgi:hypothetical protein